MARVDPRLIYDYLLSQGVSGATAQGVLANIQHESNFDPSNHTGDGGTSGGLFQHHKERLTALKNYAKSTGRAWDDWRAQVDFALKEARGMGINLQETDPVKASKTWTIKFERPANAQAKAIQRAKSVSQYAYGSGGAVAAGSGNATVNQQTQEALNLPSGGSWFRAKDGTYYVAYRFYGDKKGEGPSQVVYYTGTPPSGAQIGSATTWEKYKAGWVDGGSTDTFRGVPAGKTYQDLVDDMLMKLGLAGSDALRDQGVMAVVALAMTRELSPAELSNRLRNTKWYQDRTDKEREWDDLSQAEKDQRLVDEASKLVSMWFTYVGEDLEMASFDKNGDGLISPDEIKKGDPDLFKWAQNIASGAASQAQAINSWMKDVALENPESPWSRSVREEEQAQGQHGVDVSNMEGQIRDLYQQWGVKISDQKLKDMANKVIMNDLALADVEKALDTQASALYQAKPPGMSTRDWAEPYFQSYMSTLEVSEPDIFDPLIQRGMAEGTNMAEYQKLLRADDRWLETSNARVEMNDKISALGRVMGF